MGSSTNSDPEETAQGQSSEPSREHGTHSQNIEDTLNQFRALQEQQIDLLRGYLGQPTPIQISIPISPEPEDPWDWDHEFCVPHPCYCCRSRPRYRRIFGFDEGGPLQREKELKKKKDPKANIVWIKEDIPSDKQQKRLRDSFITSLPASSNRNIVQWPQGTVKKSESPLDIKWANITTQDSKRTNLTTKDKKRMNARKADEQMRNALKEVWPLFKFPSFEAAVSSESIERSEGMENLGDDSDEDTSAHKMYPITEESAAKWEVITTGLNRVKRSTNMIIYQMNESSDKMVCGRYVKCVRQHSEFMNFEQIALFCCIFSNMIHENESSIVALVQFLQAYTSAWEPTKRIKVESDQVCFQQFHFRYPEVCFDSETNKLNPRADHHDRSRITVFRDKGCMPKNPSPSPRQSVVERRVSILFATTNVGDSRPWKIFSFEDESVHNWKTASKSIEELLRQDTDKQPSERFFALLNTLREELESCAGFWERTLDHLEKDLRISIDKVTDATTLKKWMFDDDQNERSKLYFECLVMLQIFSDWVEDTSRDLASAVSAIPSEYSPALGITREEIKGIEAGVEDFLKEIEESFGPILGRIKQTNKEIIVLRDGMFNSTSIREAREATQQGHYILVFTVITIVYLPLAFVTGFFGMNNLENVNNSLLMSWTPFIIVFTMVASVTYIMAGLSIPWVHRNEIVRRGAALKKQVLQSHGKPNKVDTSKRKRKRRSLMEMLGRPRRRNGSGSEGAELAQREGA